MLANEHHRRQLYTDHTKKETTSRIGVEPTTIVVETIDNKSKKCVNT